MGQKKAEIGITVSPLKQGRVKLRIIGNTPLYYNAMSAKAMRTLLIGGGKKTSAEKKNLKHDPEQEFRDSVYTDENVETLLSFPAPGIKNAMATAALVTEGVAKTDVQRLVFLPRYHVPIWGRPFLKMDVVRSADMAKTPDVRTRAFLPEWCSEIEVAYVVPHLSVLSIVGLLANAGIVCGIGDFRQEKGKGAHGTFRVADMDDAEDAAEWARISAMGRDSQKAAMADATPADDLTRRLFAELGEERMRRAA